MKRTALDRRTVLRGLLATGAAVTVPLPALDVFCNANGTAWATGAAFPDRFGVWFWGGGIKPDRWTPPTTGAGWTPSSELAPLARHVDVVSVVTGCEIKTATHPHHSGMTGVLTGRPYHQLGTTRDTIVSTFAGPSVDQIAADWFSGLTPFRSLEVGVTRFRGTDEGSTFEHLSHNGPNLYNPSEYDPPTLYRRLFGVAPDPVVDLARLSVLDAVQEQAHALDRRLGSADRIRLEQYLDSVRTLEQRLSGGIGSCAVIDEPGSYPDVNGQEQIDDRNAIMSELLTLALACDLTRAFSVQWSTCGSGVIMWMVGAGDGWHVTSHEEPGSQPIIDASVVHTMSNLATFLDFLRNTPEGDGTLLDRCAMLGTSELSDGQVHTNNEFPLLVMGRGNGRLRGGVHYRSGSNRNVSDAVLTALHGAGVGLSSFGTDGGATSSVIGELLV